MNLKRLTTLSLSSNQIIQIQPGLFYSLVNLETLWLQNNKLTLLDSKLFMNLKRLTWLGLWSNQITQIELGTFDSLVNLEKLDLQNNKLTKVDNKSLFKNCKNLKGVKTEGNPFA